MTFGFCHERHLWPEAAPRKVKPHARRFFVFRRLPRAVALASIDAVRAWSIAPPYYRAVKLEKNATGGCRIRRSRRFTRREILRLKWKAARAAFVASVKTGTARAVVIPHYPEEGLAANILHVLEIVHRAPPEAPVHVNWVLSGNEIGFRYGSAGENVWDGLFTNSTRTANEYAHSATDRIDLSLWAAGKDHLKGRNFQKQRTAYHSTFTRRFEIVNQRVLHNVNHIERDCLDGRFCIGIHRRVPNAMVANLQSDGQLPSLEKLAKTVRAALSIATENGVSEHAIFLATDDADAVDGLKKEFGPAMIVREDVQRTTSDAQEVHFRNWGSISIGDAEDVLIDALLLSKCDVLVHASSSVSTLASILNPNLVLLRA